MGQQTILFFADSSQETSGFLEPVLKGAKGKGPLLNSFLENARQALAEEWNSLPSTQRALLPNFRTLDCLLNASKQGGYRHPALHLVEVVLVQLAYLISAYEQAPKEPYPSHGNGVCVGTCFGEIAAAAVALSASLNDLIPIAVDAVRIAFRGGLLALIVGSDIEGKSSNEGSWALSIPRDTKLDLLENLEALHDRLNIPPHKRAWISAFGNNTITLAGPPSSLDQISEHLMSLTDFTKVSALRRLPIYAPYHGEHVFSDEQTSTILTEPFPLASLKASPPNSSTQPSFLVGGSSTHDAADAGKLFETVLHEIFTKPLDWKTITLSCKEILAKGESSSSSVRTFGPDVQGRALASGLQKLGVEGLVFDAEFGKYSDEGPYSPTTPLAIIGFAGRFPSAEGIDEFWNVLHDGVDCVQEVPDDRFDKTVHFKDKIWGCFLDKPGLFDPRFFKMSPREALNTDPAHRLGLTTVHEALEQAGVVPNATPSQDATRIGTFWGSATEEYKEEYMAQHVDPYYIPGSSRAFAPGRVNFIYEFDGPAVSFDTACSSSMIALNHACNSVWNGDCGTAIVVGSNILCAPYSYKGLDLGHFLSKTGGCKTFDEHADGYCRGESVATVIIKKLDDAITDNDRVLGVIRAISTNHSSHSASITRPHGPTQEKLFRRLLEQANLKPTDISYVEMHGTGTQAGDTVEMNSVVNVLAPERRSDDNPLYLGAVKANAGHGEGASGITSLVKSLLMLREQKIPPHVGIKSGVRRKEPDLDPKNVRIADRVMDWKASSESHKGLRRVLISNFSAAGGNTSMILEEASPRLSTRSDDPRGYHVITVSGKSQKSLSANVERLLQWTKEQDDIKLSDFAYTTTVRRTQYEFKQSVAVSSIQDFVTQMEVKAKAPVNKDAQSANARIVFSGYTNMRAPAMQELYITSSFFKSEVSRLDQRVQRFGYKSIVPFFKSSDDKELSFLQRQLGYVVSQIAMYKLLLSWGIRPSSVTGHSLGEYVALCASGIISSDDLIYLVGLRATALKEKCELNTHGMLAVRTSPEEAQQHLQSDFDLVEVSCLNSPSDIVLSGTNANLEKVEKALATKQVKCTRVDTPLAFHSSQMDAIEEDLLRAQASIRFNNPVTPLLSPTEGRVIDSASQFKPDYFKRHTRGVVNFRGALVEGTQADPSESIWLEIGPHGICSPMVKLTLGPKTQAFSLMRKDESIWATAPKALSLFYNAGHTINWKEYLRDYDNLQVLHIPAHVLDEQHYWLPLKRRGETSVERIVEKTVVVEQPKVTKLDVKLGSKSLHKLVSRSLQDGFVMLGFETNLLEPHLYEVMQGHMMNGSYLCPASLYTDIALTIGQYLSDNEIEVQHNFRSCVANLEIGKPIIGPHDPTGKSLMLHIVAHSDLHDKRTKIRFETRDPNNGQTHVHAHCQVYFDTKQNWLGEWAKEEDAVLRGIGNLEAKLFRGLSQRLLSGLVYRLFDNVVVYGTKFKNMKDVLVDEHQLSGLANVELYQGKDCEGYQCCPYWMDGLAHLAGFLVNGLRQGSEKAVYISPGWNNFRLADQIDPNGRYQSYVKIEDHGSTVNAECYILQGDRIVGKVDGLRFQMLPRSIINRILPPGAAQQAASGHTAPVKRQMPIKQKPEIISDDSSQDSMSQKSDSGVETPQTEYSDLEDGPLAIDLRAILTDETGVDAEDIHAHTEIADLGIDSLLALTITDRLRDGYNLDSLPQDLFTIRPTFGALEEYIQNLVAPKPKRRVEKPAPSQPKPSSDPVPVPIDTNVSPESGSPQNSSTDQAKLEQVRQVIAEQMGVEPSEIAPTDDLFDLGLDSLMSLEIVEALRDVLGYELDSNFFMTANTLELVEKTLFADSVQAAEASVVETSAPVIESSAPSNQPRQKLSVVLQGNPSSCSKRLFMFPDGSGAASVYAAIPSIDEKVCVYGFNSAYLKKGVVANLTISNFVSEWVREVRDIQPQGPYHFAGYSSGGYYAYEAAKLLIEQGQTIETLICIDTPSRNVYDALPEDILDTISTTGVVGDGKGPMPSWLVDHFRSSLPAVAGYTPTPMPSHSQPKTYLIFAENGIDEVKNALVSKGKFNSGIAKFFAGKRGLLRPHGWAKLIALKNIRMAKAAGHHFSVVLSPNGQRLRDLIAGALAHDESVFETLPDGPLDTASYPKWKADCATYTADRLHSYLNRKAPASEISLKHQLNTLVSLYVRLVLENVSESESRKLAPHFQRFYRWMQDYAQRIPLGELPDEDITSLEADLAETGVDGAMLSRIGHNVLEIMREKTQALGLMLKDKLLFDYYPNTIHTSPCMPLVEVLARRELVLSKPLNILEIGAGTGGTTKAVFRAISEFEKSEGSNPGFGHYTYTDVSAGFFKQAKDTFKPWVPRMTFKKLDIESKPSTQGFEAGKYDLIVASQCLHATKNMTETMANVRELLKPGGKLLMVEGTREAPDISFIFGTLPGWWFGVEDIRQLTPCLDIPEWLNVLRATGFNGTDLSVPNCDSEVDHSLSVIISTAV